MMTCVGMLRFRLTIRSGLRHMRITTLVIYYTHRHRISGVLHSANLEQDVSVNQQLRE